MTVWITGANGFIARYLALELAAQGVVVSGIGYGAPQGAYKRQYGYTESLNGEIDASNLGALAAITGCPSVIYHLAGGSSVGASLGQPHEDFSRTVAGTERLLEWMRFNAPNTELVAVSSAAVYGSDHSGFIAEDAVLKPMSPYGQHKRMMEQLCQSYTQSFNQSATVVRLFSVYGPFLQKQLLWDICNQLEDGNRTIVLGGAGHEMRDWVHVRDVARLLSTLPNQTEGLGSFRILNGGSGVGISVAAIADRVAANWAGARIEFSRKFRAGDPVSLVSNNSRLAATGFTWSIKVDAGIEDYVKWFKGQNP